MYSLEASLTYLEDYSANSDIKEVRLHSTLPSSEFVTTIVFTYEHPEQRLQASTECMKWSDM